MSEQKSEIQVELLEIWRRSKILLKQLDNLDKFHPYKGRKLIESAQNCLRGFVFHNLGELLNEFDLPPEERI